MFIFAATPFLSGGGGGGAVRPPPDIFQDRPSAAIIFKMLLAFMQPMLVKVYEPKLFRIY